MRIGRAPGNVGTIDDGEQLGGGTWLSIRIADSASVKTGRSRPQLSTTLSPIAAGRNCFGLNRIGSHCASVAMTLRQGLSTAARTKHEEPSTKNVVLIHA